MITKHMKGSSLPTRVDMLSKAPDIVQAKMDSKEQLGEGSCKSLAHPTPPI